MTDQNNAPFSSLTPSAAPAARSMGRGLLVFAVLALLVVAGGNALTTAFGQGFGWSGWRAGGWFGAPMTPAQLDDRIDRMTKHIAVGLDASSDQQMRIAGIVKAAVADLRPLREKAQGARTQAVAVLTAPTIDRAAVERLRTEQIELAQTASIRIAQALADASEILNPDQRRMVAHWAALFDGGPWARWRPGW